MERGPSLAPMAHCQSPGCKFEVPAALERNAQCVHHFLVWLDERCATLRRETAPYGATPARHDEIAEFIRDQGERLSHVATGGNRLTDETKARVLNAFLGLINLRENLERAMERLARSKASPAQ